MWGFSGEIVFAEVASAAFDILGRCDSYGLPLGPDRIEQLHKKRSARRRWMYSKPSLYERCPNKMASVYELASVLLKNGGQWPPRTRRVRLLDGSWLEREGSAVIPGSLVLSPKWQKELAKRNYPRIVGWKLAPEK